MEVLIVLAIGQAVASGGFCAYIASQKRRNSGAWFFLGLLFGIFALIAIGVVPRGASTSSAPGELETSPSRLKARFANRGDSVRLALLLVTGALMLADLALIFFWVPLEQSMGILFLIVYFHVPLALAGFLAVGIVFISSILYLWKGQRKWDALAHSAAEIGVLFITLTIITGAIWAKKFNGVWWTWDPRLTTTLILWLMYVGYLMVRSYAPTPSQAARYSAVMGIISFIDVPIVYLSAVWWRNIIHPNLYLGPLAEEGSLDSRMEAAVMFSLLTFTFLLAYLVWERLAQRNSEDALQEVRYTQGAY